MVEGLAGLSTPQDKIPEPRAWLRSQFTELARQAKAADPELLGRQLVFLYDGAALAASVDGDRHAPEAARALAAQMLP